MKVQKSLPVYVAATNRLMPQQKQDKIPDVYFGKSFLENKNITNILRNNALGSIAVSSTGDKIIKAKNELREKFKIKEVDYSCVEDTSISTFSKIVQHILVNNNINIKADIISVLNDAKNITNQSIEEDAKKISHFSSAIQLYFGEILRKEFLESLSKEIANCSEEILSENDLKRHISSVFWKLYEKHSYEDLDKKIQNKLLSATDDEIHIKKIELSKDDMDKLKASFSNHKVEKDDYDMEKLAEIFISEYVAGNYALKRLPAHIITACLQTQKRYNSSEKKYTREEKEPVYRWLCVNDTANFINSMPAVGDIYSYQHMQSCSKNKYYAENQFKDDNPDLNIKFIIHPLAKTSQAYDIGERKYGDNEVIYPPNTKFRFLGSEIVSDYKQNESHATSSNTFCRYVVHLQEVLTEN